MKSKPHDESPTDPQATELRAELHDARKWADKMRRKATHAGAKAHLARLRAEHAEDDANEALAEALARAVVVACAGAKS